MQTTKPASQHPQAETIFIVILMLDVYLMAMLVRKTVP